MVDTLETLLIAGISTKKYYESLFGRRRTSTLAVEDKLPNYLMTGVQHTGVVH
jgi:hypothetical protein